jgi:hypothetical protein
LAGSTRFCLKKSIPKKHPKNGPEKAVFISPKLSLKNQVVIMKQPALMNIESFSNSSGFNALIETKSEGYHTTDGNYYSPHGVVECYSEALTDGSKAGTQIQMALHGRHWLYGDRRYRAKLALGRLAAKFAREVNAKKHE